MQGKLSTVDEGDTFDFFSVCEQRWIIQKRTKFRPAVKHQFCKIFVIEYCQVYHTFKALPRILQVWNTLRNSLITLKQQDSLSLLRAALLN